MFVISPLGVLVLLLVSAFVGLLAGRLLRSHFGSFGDILTGMGGGIIAPSLVSAVNGVNLSYGGTLAVTVIGAIFATVLARVISRTASNPRASA